MENERLSHLKVKIKSLAAEAVIIRQEARKVSGRQRYVLNCHRTEVVRPAARHSLLAYSILRGRPYELMEKKCYQPPNWKTVAAEAKRFGGEEVQIVEWIEKAKEYIKENKVDTPLCR